jgi:hypothetical protein
MVGGGATVVGGAVVAGAVVAGAWVVTVAGGAVAGGAVTGVGAEPEVSGTVGGAEPFVFATAVVGTDRRVVVGGGVPPDFAIVVLGLAVVVTRGRSGTAWTAITTGRGRGGAVVAV